MGKYQLKHTKTSSTHSVGNIDLHNNTKDRTLHSMENVIPFEPLNERNICRRENDISSETGNDRSLCSKENVLLCDKCCVENVKPAEFCPSCKGTESIVQVTELDPVSSCVSDNRVNLQGDYSLYTGSHGIFPISQSIHMYPGNSCMSDNREKIQKDYQKCTGSQGIYSSKRDFSQSMSDKGMQIQKDYQECTGHLGILSLGGDSTKYSMDLPCTCRITHHQSRSSLSVMDNNLSIHLSRIKFSQTRPLTGSNLNVINQVSIQKKRESIPKTLHKRTERISEDILHHRSLAMACKQKKELTNSPRDDLIDFQRQTASSPSTMDTNKVSHKSQEFTQKLADKLPFQALHKCSLLIHKCTLMASKSSLVTSFQEKVPIQKQSLSQCNAFQDKVSPHQQSLPSQCNPAGTNTALYIHHNAVTLLNRTKSSSVFTNPMLILLSILNLLPLLVSSANKGIRKSLLILLCMLTKLPLHVSSVNNSIRKSMFILLCVLATLPLPTKSATNGIPCLYKGSLKSDCSWFGFLTNITIMNTGRMTFQFSYPAEKCCQNILFYLEDQVSILNARMNCWQKESLLR